MNDLTLEVGEVDDVEIDHAQRAHSGSREIKSQRRTKSTCAHAKNFCGFQLELPIHADLGHDQVARVAQNFVVAQGRGGASCFSKSCHKFQLVIAEYVIGNLKPITRPAEITC